MNKIKSAAASTKKFVHEHRVAIAVTITAISTTAVALVWNHEALREHDEFLESKGLIDEFYAAEIVAA